MCQGPTICDPHERTLESSYLPGAKRLKSDESPGQISNALSAFTKGNGFSQSWKSEGTDSECKENLSPPQENSGFKWQENGSFKWQENSGFKWQTNNPMGLEAALWLLDSDRDGRIWGQDLDDLMELAFSVDLRQAAEGWGFFKAACEVEEGYLDLSCILEAFYSGRLHLEASTMLRRAQSPKTVLEPSWVKGALGPFSDVGGYVRCFVALDCDQDGVICARDLMEGMFARTGVLFTLDECKDFIDEVDQSCNGVVNLSEFGALMSFLHLDVAGPTWHCMDSSGVEAALDDMTGHEAVGAKVEDEVEGKACVGGKQ